MSRRSLTQKDEQWRSKNIPWHDIDENIKDIIANLNSMSGVCTLQSCEGHRRGKYIDDACLWVWLSDDRWAAVERSVESLVNNPLIHRVSKCYVKETKDGYVELLDIRFAGLGSKRETREADFVQAKEDIITFLSSPKPESFAL